MVRGPALIFLLGLAAAHASPASACNPQAPRPPVLERGDYDATARELLIKASTTVAVGRFERRLELSLAGQVEYDYVFSIIEGWKAPVPRRLVVDGQSMPCEPALRAGGLYLIYFDGRRPVWFVPAEFLDEELQLLADVSWYYGPRGELVTPDLAVGEEPGT
jgi:hypothetical protein